AGVCPAGSLLPASAGPGRVPRFSAGLERAARGRVSMTRPPASVRVVAVTQSDPFFTGRFFEAFLTEGARERLALVEIVLLRNFNESRRALARRLLRLYGPLDLARLLGRYAAARCRDRLGAPH